LARALPPMLAISLTVSVFLIMSKLSC
jgi:hypothetical protein